MTTSELIFYIKKQINNNISKELIISKLTEAGWRKEDIDEGFSSIESELKPTTPSFEAKRGIDNINPIKRPQVIADQYREPIGTNGTVETKKVELPKIEVSNIENQKVEITPIATPLVEIPIVEPQKTEIPIMKTPTVETPKVWIPRNVPIKEDTSIKDENLETKKEETKIIIQNQELEIKKPAHNAENIASVDGEEFIPTLIPKVVVNSFGSINKKEEENLPKTEDALVFSDEKPKDSLIDSLPKIAMLSSYQNDLSTGIKTEEENIKKKSHKMMKWIILALVISILALATWAFASGYINIKNLNIPFVRKDPKVLLLNNSKVLSSLKSYKTETNVEISSPSFSNIALGLVSGEAVNSLDKDSISINTLGVINQNENGLLSDNFVTIRSSLLQDYITTDIKNNGLNLFVSVPDLSEIINENAPEPSMVKINEQQFSLIPPLFSRENETTLKKINLYKILSSGMSSYINSKTLSVYNEFINNTDITKKGEESIKGIDTYHYSINTDRQLAKKLLSEISENFVLSLSSDDKNGLDQILGSVTVESLDVWIGKGDNNIYQYNVILDVPLSKIIGFEDKSIGDNKVSINWKTTYYDFNISNNVTMPEISIDATDFVESIEETKIKNDVSSFKQLATNLFNIEKTYGKKSNLGGSCMKPISGSLFSPTGHIKGATSAISSISLLLNKILEKTNNVGYCYSTTKTWSFTIPISNNYNSTTSTPEYKSYFCIDDSGPTFDLTAPPTGVVCSPKVAPKTN
jgi:hypothetical protein